MHLQGKSLYSRFLCSWKKIAFIFILTLFPFSFLSAQTTLAPGDVGVIGFNTTNNDPSADNFAFVLLVDVEENTVIYFTDSGVMADGCLRNNEGIIKWTAPAGGCSAGTMVQMFTDALIIEGPGIAEVVKDPFSLNKSGDQIIVFQHSNEAELTGSSPCPEQYIFALTNNGAWQSDCDDSHTSIQPPGLDDTNSVAIPVVDGVYSNNATFDCDDFASGSAEDILSAITNSDNWSGWEENIAPLPDCIFTVGDLWVKYITYNQMQLIWRELDDNIEMVIVYHTAEITDSPSPGETGSSYIEGGNFETTGKVAAIVTNAADTFKVVDAITGLTEGQVYYFKAFAHNKITNPEVWFQSKVSIPESAIAYVQEPAEPSATLSAGTNATIDFTWTNYDAPTADWWDGGAVIIARLDNPVTVGRAEMNAIDESIINIAIDDVMVDGSFVAGIITDGAELASVDFDNCGTYHFKIFHKDGVVSNDDKWSDGVAFGPVTTRCPEIAVTGNSVVIADGSTTPSLADHTDFGEVLAEETLDRTFTIKNTGTGTITLTDSPEVVLSGTGASAFSVSAQPGTNSLGALAETTFTVTFTSPAGCTGTPYTATVSIANDDIDENPYTFDIQAACVTGCFTMSPLSGTPGTVVTISGAGFSDVPSLTTIFFDGVEADVTFVSSTQITAVVPAGVTGLVDVTSGNTPSLPIGCNQFNVIASPGTCPH